jgi:hypothetical protein
MPGQAIVQVQPRQVLVPVDMYRGGEGRWIVERQGARDFRRALVT